MIVGISMFIEITLIVNSEIFRLPVLHIQSPKEGLFVPERNCFQESDIQGTTIFERLYKRNVQRLVEENLS